MSSNQDSDRLHSWFLYILECKDGSFYTGITKNLDRRLNQHNHGRASRYTQGRLPVKIRYQEPCAGRSAALIREARVKSFTRKKKEKLIERGEG
ncbi:MAG TPA: GIY-YIG nuclease family protein [Candidatus Manganitrophaceae bacterium]|nr:GIY-YIG nuclease family protein [Candidatus Manganitrophaceae bacterium]